MDEAFFIYERDGELHKSKCEENFKKIFDPYVKTYFDKQFPKSIENIEAHNKANKNNGQNKFYINLNEKDLFEKIKTDASNLDNIKHTNYTNKAFCFNQDNNILIFYLNHVTQKWKKSKDIIILIDEHGKYKPINSISSISSNHFPCAIFSDNKLYSLGRALSTLEKIFPVLNFALPQLQSIKEIPEGSLINSENLTEKILEDLGERGRKSLYKVFNEDDTQKHITQIQLLKKNNGNDAITKAVDTLYHNKKDGQSKNLYSSSNIEELKKILLSDKLILPKNIDLLKIMINFLTSTIFHNYWEHAESEAPLNIIFQTT